MVLDELGTAMKPFTSFSQAGQDRFALAMCPDGKTFLDIGACHPIEISNTYGLEQLGWRGVLFDNDPGAIETCHKARQSPALLRDMTDYDWNNEFLNAAFICYRNGHQERVPFEPSSEVLYGYNIDYLSLDVDAASLPTLKRIPFDRLKFRVLTVETDVYRFGEPVRDAMRAILCNAGYDLVCADVCSVESLPYEDWYCSHELSKRADPFRCSNKKWTEIFPA